MKTCRFFGIAIAALAILTFGVAGEVMAAGWTWMHGSAAVIEAPSNTNWNRVMKQGLDLDMKHGMTTNVHIGIQTPIVPGSTTSENKADKIQLQIFLADDIKITKVSVYTGAYLLQEIVGDILTTDGVHYFFKEIPIDTTKYFPYGLGISLEVVAGSNSSLSHRFCLAAAGVHWTGTTSTDSHSSVTSGDLGNKGVLEPVSPPPPPTRK